VGINAAQSIKPARARRTNVVITPYYTIGMSEIRRFFVEGRHGAGDVVTLEGTDAHKVVHVLRMRDGDAVEVIDSAAQRFNASITIDGRAVRATLHALSHAAVQTPAHVTIAQGIPKGQKMDFVVEKLTELGAAAIVPLQSERTIVSDVSPNKLLRWRRLAKTAAQQCGRADIPEIRDPISFDALLRTFESYDCVLLPWELADDTPLRERLPALLADARKLLVLIGPEGGFSHAEAEAAERSGAELISLGPRILRTETAGLVALAVIGYVTAS
jgi:16S rRNA (uracil1498-N3)-methyltransferase